jgi:chromosome segregation ATPase
VGIKGKLERASDELEGDRNTDQGDNSGTDSDEKDLEQEVQKLKESLTDLRERVKEIEDRNLMAELEELSMKEQVEEVQEIIDIMDSEDLEQRLKILERIQDEYKSGKVHEKLEYLYSEVKDLKENSVETDNAKLDSLEDRVKSIENKVEGLSQVNTQAPESGIEDDESVLQEVVRESEDLRLRRNSDGEMVVEAI